MRNPRILIFDEPTAVLTAEESDSLLAILRQLSDNGRAIVFITHKLREALALGDRITVLRGGKVVGSPDPATTTIESLGSMMVGRSLHAVEREPGEGKDASEHGAVLSVREVGYASRTLTGASIRSMSFEVPRAVRSSGLSE